MSATLRPVVVCAPAASAGAPRARGVERVRLQRERAYTALALSAARSGAELGPLAKDADDAPLASNGWSWSVSHASEAGAAIVAREPVGIDVEEVRERSSDLVAALAADDEWTRIGGFSWSAFARLWTAKEALLKKERVGLSALSRCRLVRAPARGRLVLAYDGREHVVALAEREGHVAAVCAGEGDVVEWSWEAA